MGHVVPLVDEPSLENIGQEQGFGIVLQGCADRQYIHIILLFCEEETTYNKIRHKCRGIQKLINT